MKVTPLNNRSVSMTSKVILAECFLSMSLKETALTLFLEWKSIKTINKGNTKNPTK